jgi:hypothetical protein
MKELGVESHVGRPGCQPLTEFVHWLPQSAFPLLRETRLLEERPGVAVVTSVIVGGVAVVTNVIVYEIDWAFEPPR